MILKNVNSAVPGNVLESRRAGPLANPRDKFFCIRISFDMKASADSIGYVLVNAKRWGAREVMMENDGLGGLDAYKIWSTKIDVRTCRTEFSKRAQKSKEHTYR